MDTKIVLFGAARMGIDYYSEHKENVVYFFDNDSHKWGKEIDGVPIIQPKFLGQNYQVIVANDKHDIDMVSQLLELGYRKFSVIYPMGKNIGTGAFGINEFDYSSYGEITVVDRRVALLSNTTSGSNTWCFKHVVEDFIKDNTFELCLLQTKNKTHDFYYTIFTSRFIILTSSFTSLKNKIIIQCFHGMPVKVAGYMDKNIVDTSFELTHRDMISAKYVLSYGKFYSMWFGACFGVPANRYLEIGEPRNDLLLLSNGRSELEVKFPELKNKFVVLYMPTYRERTLYSDEDTRGYIFMYPDFDIESFDNFLEENGCKLLIKMHIEDTKRFANSYKDTKNILFLTDDDFVDTDFYGYINGTDALITDYSSIYFDYLLLDKPIAFSHLDYDLYAEERGFMLDNPDFWYPGPRVRSIEQLRDAIKQMVSGQDSYCEHRGLIKKIVHGNYSGECCAKLLKKMKEECL